MFKKVSIYLLFIFSAPSIFGQSFCESNLGHNWVAVPPLELKDHNFFEYDTIPFRRFNMNDTDYCYIQLSCKDSTYKVIIVYKESTLGTNRDKVAIEFQKLAGTWRYDKIDNTISFYINESKESYEFVIDNIGNKETNKKDLWRSDGDYRTNIFLIKN